MQALVSVLKDLYLFSAESLGFKAKPVQKNQTEILNLPPLSSHEVALRVSNMPLAQSNTTAAVLLSKQIITLSQTKPALVLPPAISPTTVAPERPKEIVNYDRIGYVASARARVYARATVFFDGVLEELPYASKIEILGYEGRFVHVRLDEVIKGWVLKEDITQNQSDIIPTFEVGQTYVSDNLETKRLRSYIADTFSATDLYLSLQPEEFAFYKIMHKGHKISWPKVRPRLAGSWQTVLKGQPGVKMSIEPKTGAVIEFMNSAGEGWVGYTTAVLVDETIKIEGVGHNNEGEYLEETIPKSEWLEWRPVWISVS